MFGFGYVNTVFVLLWFMGPCDMVWFKANTNDE